MLAPDFLRRHLPALGKTVFRLGLSASFGLPEAGVQEALERIQYLYLTPKMPLAPIRRALAHGREQYVLVGGPPMAYFPGSCRRAVERALRRLGTDYLDVLQISWLGVMSALTGAMQEEMARLRREGKVRTLGASIHDRQRAGRLALDSILDLLMVRYNAAHPGAEVDLFPHLARRRPAVVAYTATSWRKLLRAPQGHTGRVPTAGDCYRFCLTHPAVDLVLTGPRTVDELRQNLAEVEKGPLPPEEVAWMRSFGRLVHG
ncbi:MAG TPA: aldo/keto reductase [Anaeromyxobacter sp.]|nr:aldo/keto reductase [Anaeromyxobacter sp.]